MAKSKRLLSEAMKLWGGGGWGWGRFGSPADLAHSPEWMLRLGVGHAEGGAEGAGIAWRTCLRECLLNHTQRLTRSRL